MSELADRLEACQPPVMEDAEMCQEAAARLRKLEAEVQEHLAANNLLRRDNDELEAVREAAEDVREVDCTIFCCDKETWANFCGALDDVDHAACGDEDG